MLDSPETVEVEIRTLSGQLGVVQSPSSISGWELSCLISSKFPAPVGCYWSIAIKCQLIDNGIINLVDASAVTCVASSPDMELQTRVTREWAELIRRGCAEEDLPLQSRQVWCSLLQVGLPHSFNQSLENVRFPAGLQSLTFGSDFNQSMEKVILPAGLQSLTFGASFNQNIDKVVFPDCLQHLTFGTDFDRDLDRVTFPTSLTSVTFGLHFNRRMDKVKLPPGLHHLIFGDDFNQRMDNVNFPHSLRTLTFGYDFDQEMDDVVMPPQLETVTYGGFFTRTWTK